MAAVTDLARRVEVLEAAVLALGVQEFGSLEFGDSPGHAFHGNQYTGQTGGALREDFQKAGAGVQKDGSIIGGNSNATGVTQLVTVDQHKAIDAAGFKFGGLHDHDRLVGFDRGAPGKGDDSHQKITLSNPQAERPGQKYGQAKTGVNATWNEYRASSRYGDGPVMKGKQFDSVESAIKFLDKKLAQRSWEPK